MKHYNIFSEIFALLKCGYRKQQWQKLHPNSDTIPMNSFDFTKVDVGKGTYGELNVVDFGDGHKLILKNYISIAQKVTFILDAEHYWNHISTYPFKVKMLHMQEKEAFGKGDIVVEDDVWIGYGATIMSGVHIGQGAVVAAGAVITKDIPSYAIVSGVPGRVLRYRFNEEIIQRLLKVDFEKLTDDMVKDHLNELYSDIIEINKLNWLPDREY